jgi:protein SCO1/2
MLKQSTSFVLTAAFLAAAAPLCAQRLAERPPAELEGVGITEHLGDQVDLDLTFIAENGYPVKLRDYFGKGKPVLLNLVYYTCPMLCNLVLNSQVEALRSVPWTPGNEFEIVTISIDPTENFKMASDKKASYLTSYDRPAPGWHWLVDNDGNVQKLARQVGFGYKLNEATGQYAHAAAIFVLTPEGKVSRYLYGVKFKPFDLRLALAEAGQGKTGISVERVLLYCFHYDPQAKGYVVFARNLMRAGGVLTLIVLGMFLWIFWRRERKAAAHPHEMVTAK